MSHPWASASLACLISLALIALDTAAVAQTAPGQSCEGHEITRLDIDAPPGTDMGRVRDAIRFREGDLYSEEAARAAVAAIYALGDFTKVSVEPALISGGVSVVFHLKVRPRVHDVRYEGDLGDCEKALPDLLQAKVGAAASPYGLKADREAIRSHFIDEGYLFAEVRQETKDVEDGIDIVYHIEAGPKLTVEGVRFEGNAGVPDEDILPVMMGVKAGGILERGKYDPALLRSDLLAVRELFRRRGYLDATVGHEVLFDESKERAYLVVRVLEGPLYGIERMTIQGTHIRSTDEVLAVMKSHEEGPYAQEQLDKDFEAIRSLYGRIGYIKADVQIARSFSEKEPKVRLTLTVTEGEQYYVNKVIIRGNLITQDHVIRRSVTVLPGDLANSDELEETKRRLQNTGYFSVKSGAPGAEAVRVRFIDSTQPGKTDVLVEVVEGNMGDFSIGAGFSSTQGLIGTIRLTHRNFDATKIPTSWAEIMRGEAFAGDGQELTISVSPGTIVNDYRLNWTNPSVWDTDYSVGFDLYLHDFIWTDFYTEQHAGGSITVGRRFFKDLTVSLTPRWEWVTIKDLDPTAPADAVKADEAGRQERRSLQLGVTYDRRDSPLLTTGGYRLSASAEMAGTVFGGDVDVLKETFEARKWFTICESSGWGEYFMRGKQILSVGASAGIVGSTGSDGVPIFERYFMGGLGSLRGFSYRRVGPVDDVFHKQIGGDYMILTNTEYEVPIVRDYFRFVVFVETGDLGSTGSEMGNIRADAGAGVRLRLPVPGFERIPISLYLATPLVSRAHDQTEVFSFEMGTGFGF
ncbi:MAG: outer membrane protein assembly factor BamA [Candidatus Brocadiia bacterium]|jgi:outer membrane protein insertion porin family